MLMDILCSVRGEGKVLVNLSKRFLPNLKDKQKVSS